MQLNQYQEKVTNIKDGMNNEYPIRYRRLQVLSSGKCTYSKVTHKIVAQNMIR